MRRLLKSLKNEESGQTFILVLCMLVLGSLLMVPLLNLSASSIQYHETIERNTVETYSAEAGVEYAVGKLGNSPETYMTTPLDYNFTTNNKTVDVTTEYLGNDVFIISSTAATDAGRSTTIESYVELSAPDFSYLPENAITSPNDIYIQPGGTVNGDVQYNGILDNKGVINGVESTEPIPWPLINDAQAYYWNDVKNLVPYPVDSIDLKFTTNIGPTYVDGPFTVNNTDKDGAILQLDGTLYVAGDLNFDQPGGSKTFMLNLNNQTIFAEGNITFPSANIAVWGNGCIIAMGTVDFHPSTSSSWNHFVFIMSINDVVNFQPNGDFTGSLAGDVMVDLQPGSSITWIEPPWDLLNIPQGDFDNGNYGGAAPTIVSWQIK
ncbi:hypothetical protein ACFLUH_01460 [Chloroflexota bacterium]